MTFATRAGRALSLAVTVAALLFVGWAVRDAGAAAGIGWGDPALWSTIALAGIVYGAALLLVALAWLLMVRAAAPDARLPARLGLRIYGITQIYKYLPSNLLHYVGRHAALRRLGVGHTAAAIGAGGEMALLLAAAFAVAVAGGQVALLGDRAAGLALGGAAVLACLAAALWAAPPLLARFRLAEPVAQALGAPKLRPAALRAFGCYVLFFLISGGAFALIAITVGKWGAGDMPLLAAIWAGCWAVGFITPGAPGGIGVREALLIGALGAAGGAEGAAQAALAMRLATILGDLALASLAWAAGPREARAWA